MAGDAEDEPGTALVKRSMADIVEHLSDDFVAVNRETKGRKDKERYRRALAGLVFAYWAAKYDHKRALLDPKRERRLMARLEECQDKVSDLLWALDGGLKDDWVMGRDRHSTRKYDDLETILRDRAQIEKFGERMKGFRDDLVHPMAKKYLGEGT